jgi:hypothetical protein
MYYPYLRGRQFELIALREFATQKGDNNYVIPIIEPVKNTFNSFNLAIPKFIEGNLNFAVILNPNVGEVQNTQEILDGLGANLETAETWIPALIVKNNFNELTELINEFNLDNVMLICTDITDTTTNEFNELISQDKIRYIVSPENRTLKRRLRGLNKKLIRIDDNFKAQPRNSDYLKMPETKFTEEHIFYKEDGYNGFSDYTALVSEFLEGGGAPYAVAIHITYQKENNEIWVKHFTSYSNDDRANIQGKFAEAATKAVSFFDDNNIHNSSSEELRGYIADGKYPGLGMVKKISIKNHLELMNDVLNTTE